MNVISLQVHHFYCIISEIKKRVILQQTIYMYTLNNEEGEILLWGERLLYSQISPGEKLLYSQFSGGKGYYGGKATIQQRNQCSEGFTFPAGMPRIFVANAPWKPLVIR